MKGIHSFVVVLALAVVVQPSSASEGRQRYLLSFASFAPLNSDIFVATADGSQARALFANPAQECNASFSPDGSWFVFTSTRSGSGDIYRANLNHSQLERIVDHPAYDDQATISPDGAAVAFVSSRSGNADVWVLDLASRSVRNVTQHPAGDFRPAWSPDGKWLAFSSDRASQNPIGPGGFAVLHSTEVFIVRPDGSDLRQMTQYSEVAGSPSWSPDSQLVVFSHATLEAAANIASPRLLRGTTDIREVNIASGRVRVLTADEGEKRWPHILSNDRLAYVSGGPDGGIEFANESRGARGEFHSPTWSADGKHMLFHRDVDKRWPPHYSVPSLDPQFELMRVGVFSSWSPSGDRMVSNDRTAGILHNGVISTRPDGSDLTVLFKHPEKSALAPVWSRQGDRIAFALGQFFQAISGTARADIVTIKADGSDLQILTNGQSNFGFPSWSPDGKHIVYREASAGRRALHVINVASRKSRVLIEGAAHYNFPGWSPKEDVIAFTSNMDGNYEIYSIRADGTGLKRLTHSPQVDGHSSWSPDGKWIAFSSGRQGFKDEFLTYQANPQAYGEIYVMRADGSEQHPLTDNPFEEATPGWRLLR